MSCVFVEVLFRELSCQAEHARPLQGLWNSQRPSKHLVKVVVSKVAFVGLCLVVTVMATPAPMTAQMMALIYLVSRMRWDT